MLCGAVLWCHAAGHDADNLSEGRVWCLDTQIQHKVQLLKEHVMAPGKPPAVVLAHSIGSYMMLQVSVGGMPACVGRRKTRWCMPLQPLLLAQHPMLWQMICTASTHGTARQSSAEHLHPVGTCSGLDLWVPGVDQCLPQPCWLLAPIPLVLSSGHQAAGGGASSSRAASRHGTADTPGEQASGCTSCQHASPVRRWCAPGACQ